MTTKKPQTLAGALAAAQSQMSNVQKNAKNPHFRNSYADLSAVRDVVIPALNEQGIAVVQHVDGAENCCTVRTVLYGYGETLEAGNCTLPINGARNAAQAIGSITTYLRRYQLAALGGVSQVDDDGNAAPAPTQQRRRPPAQGPKAVKSPIPCPICAGPTWDNREYRQWRKDNPNSKDKPALACNDWKGCKWTAWSTSEAEAIINASAEPAPETFDDGL